MSISLRLHHRMVSATWQCSLSSASARQLWRNLVASRLLVLRAEHTTTTADLILSSARLFLAVFPFQHSLLLDHSFTGRKIPGVWSFPSFLALWMVFEGVLGIMGKLCASGILIRSYHYLILYKRGLGIDSFTSASLDIIKYTHAEICSAFRSSSSNTFLYNSICPFCSPREFTFWIVVARKVVVYRLHSYVRMDIMIRHYMFQSKGEFYQPLRF